MALNALLDIFHFQYANKCKKNWFSIQLTHFLRYISLQDKIQFGYIPANISWCNIIWLNTANWQHLNKYNQMYLLNNIPLQQYLTLIANIVPNLIVRFGTETNIHISTSYLREKYVVKRKYATQVDIREI